MRSVTRSSVGDAAVPKRATTTMSSPEPGTVVTKLSARSDEMVLSRSAMAVALTSFGSGLVCFQTSGPAGASAVDAAF